MAVFIHAFNQLKGLSNILKGHKVIVSISCNKISLKGRKVLLFKKLFGVIKLICQCSFNKECAFRKNKP
jgi:hypothetical protein